MISLDDVRGWLSWFSSFPPLLKAILVLLIVGVWLYFIAAMILLKPRGGPRPYRNFITWLVHQPAPLRLIASLVVTLFALLLSLLVLLPPPSPATPLTAEAASAGVPTDASGMVDVDFSRVDTNVPGGSIVATPYLHDYGITIANLSPGDSLLRFRNNSALYEGKAVHPTTSQNILTQDATGNKPAAFTLVFKKPVSVVQFTRPRLIAYTDSGITHPAWSAHALDAQGKEVASAIEGLIRSYDDVDAHTFTLEATPSDPITAVTFLSDPNIYDQAHPHGKPFAAFSSVLIERLLYKPGK